MSERQSHLDVEAKRAKLQPGKLGRFKPGPKNYPALNFLPHLPNRIPFGEQVRNIVMSLFLLGYGGYSLSVGDLYIPARRSDGFHLHGFSALSMAIAMAFASAMLLAVVVDHYDTRANEDSYRRFSSLMKYAAVSFFALSMFLYVLAV